ncbi:MAG: HDIG domain-containing protein [Bacilli bacterium]|nr:HDIG domain-containing protein [Bacilli bacterium]
MTQYLNFSGNYYRNITKHKITANYENNRTSADAFLLCIKDLPYEELDNLCKEIEQYYRYKENPISLSLEDCYKLTQGQDTQDILCDKEFKQILLSLAYQCIDKGITVGSKLRENSNDSTTSWISHCLYQGETAAVLAKNLGLDSDTARKLGILHDIGRKYIHTLLHTVAGFETLVDEGWTDEAFVCLTHSFIGNPTTHKGGRCCGCDPALPGFYLDEEGNPNWQPSAEKDDVTSFLESYNYNLYDSIINMSDLMATSYGTLAPYDRVADISTRTTPDPQNKNYFKAEFSNLMLHLLEQSGEITVNNIGTLKATSDISDSKMDEIFYSVSALFTDYYNQICRYPTKSLQNKENSSIKQ